MFEFLKKIFLMDEEAYINTIEYYSHKFDLHWDWKFSVVEDLPNANMNYDSSKALACTDFVNRQVNFKTMIFKKNPKFMAKAYIRHELRHCQQMEKIHSAIMAKGLESLAGIYTMMVINNDNLKGYQNSMMEADAWLAFIGIYINIDKVVKKLIKRNIGFLL